jgi:glycosyltransferase involved in cell wall biosynthesis
MANILVLNVKVPFTAGGQDVLVRSLVAELKKRGHLADTVELPFQVNPKDVLLNQIALWRSIDFSEYGGNKVDLIIATKFPSYFAKHHTKSLWLVHQVREMYDLFGGRFSDYSDDPRDEVLRQELIEADLKALAEFDYIATISGNVTKRLKTYNSTESEVLYPPLALAGQYYNAPAQDYILSVGRICSIKRVDFMLKAMPIVHQHIKLKIVGIADEPGVMDYLKNEIDKHHLWDRVEFLGRTTDQELLDLYANSLAVYYAPHNEDYGYVTLEAMASSKPVIAATDSGGVLEFIEHEFNGIVAEPTIDSIGHATNRLVENKDFAKQLGENGRKRLDTLGLEQSGWDKVIDRLLSPLK